MIVVWYSYDKTWKQSVHECLCIYHGLVRDINDVWKRKEWEIWHKQLYHMYSDVIFGWVLWIWLSSWHFFLSILILFRDRLQEKIETLVVPRAPRRALGTTKVPIFFLQAIAKKIKISEKSANYQPNPQYQPKKRHYLYNIMFLKIPNPSLGI